MEFCRLVKKHLDAYFRLKYGVRLLDASPFFELFWIVANSMQLRQIDQIYRFEMNNTQENRETICPHWYEITIK